MKNNALRYIWLLLLAASFVGGAVHGQALPAARGHINDLKGVLSPAVANQLEMRLRTFGDSNTVELAVVIMDLPEGEDHALYTSTLARTWGIGDKDADNGALLAIYPNVHKTRIEVGYGLEPVLTDAMCTIILTERVRPNLKNDNYDAAVSSALEEMMRLSSKEFRSRKPVKKQEESGTGFFIAGMLLMFVGLPLLFFFGARRGNRRNKNNRNNRNNDGSGGGGYYDSGPVIIGGGWGSSGSDSGWSSSGDSGSSGGGDFGGFSGGDFGGGGASSDW